MSKLEQTGLFSAILIGFYVAQMPVGAVITVVLMAVILNLPDFSKPDPVDPSIELRANIAEQDKKIQDLKERFELLRISKR